MDKRELERRRKRLMAAMEDGGIAIVPAAPVQRRNGDVEFPYRPDSNFFYLTGFPEPEALAVLIPGRAQGQFILFCRERDAAAEAWQGRRAGLEGACAEYGADDAFPISDLDDILPGLLENRARVYYTMGCNLELDQRLMGWVNQVRGRYRTGVTAPQEFVSLSHIVHEMRLLKSPQEIKLMRKAAALSAHAHRRAMAACRPGLREFQLEAELTHEFMAGGSRATAYPSIVGGGANGCILHYTANSDVLNDGDLVLIDAGAEYQGYASDITRTFPVNGRFAPAQQAVYEVVLAAQLAAISKLIPGNHWNDPHQEAIRVLTRGLIALGVLKGHLTRLIKEEAYKPYFMHRTGHWLGMDVHDVGDYKVGNEWRMLEPGMVLTVEPGLYLKAGAKGLAKRWWNIGIRIEDDVLVTRDGHEVLSAAAPKQVEEMESWIAHGRAH
ncbi:MAG: Xaa-Pro aminopeptidase [Gammaproteobacteria bacterium]